MTCCPSRQADVLTSRPASGIGDAPGAGNRAPDRFVRVEACVTTIGTDLPELLDDGEGPVRTARLRAFAIDPFAVTNRWFAEFTAATGYRTEAERFGNSFVFAQFLPAETRETRAVQQAPWWRMVEGADWAHPEGPGSTLSDRSEHPAVHISFRDAQAFAAWAGGRLPSEAEWEHAARGGIAGARFPWGAAEPDDASHRPCNIWQGRFPKENTGADGYHGTAPVDAFDANGYGLFNMAGNVWEWCADPFRVRSLSRQARTRNEQAVKTNDRVAKGGSYMCHRSYCYRYRIAARSGLSATSSAGHTGLRLVFDVPGRELAAVRPSAPA